MDKASFREILKGVLRRGLILLLEGYRRSFTLLMPYCCRFYPTCSVYTQEAVQKKGIYSGLKLAFFRILRCHPFHAGGYDPVR